MKSNVLGCACAALLGAATVVATPAMARGGFGGGGHGFSGGGHMMSMGGGHFGPMFAGRSVAMGSFNRAGRFDPDGRFGHRFSRFDRDDRFRHFRNRFAVFNGFDDFAFFGLPFAYDYAAYGNGCWRWDGWQWINACYDYGY